MTNITQSIRWGRQEALLWLADMGVPPVLLTDAQDLTMLACKMGYAYKTHPAALPLHLGLARWVRALNTEAHLWWC